MPGFDDWKLLLDRAAEESGDLEIGLSGDRNSKTPIGLFCFSTMILLDTAGVPIPRAPDHGAPPILYARESLVRQENPDPENDGGSTINCEYPPHLWLCWLCWLC